MVTSKVLLRVKSNRARDMMQAALSYLPQGYYASDAKGEFREVSETEMEKLQGIKGLSRARVDKTKLRRYWNWF